MSIKMDGTGFRRAIQTSRLRRVRAGDPVRVISGSLDGFRGTVVGFSGNCRVVLRLDDLDNGVRVILPFEAVELAD